MNSFQLAIYLTSIGLGQGRKYSYMGVEAFNIDNRREYIVRHKEQEHRFKSPGDAGLFFTNYVTKLRRG